MCINIKSLQKIATGFFFGFFFWLFFLLFLGVFFGKNHIFYVTPLKLKVILQDFFFGVYKCELNSLVCINLAKINNTFLRLISKKGSNFKSPHYLPRCKIVWNFGFGKNINILSLKLRFRYLRTSNHRLLVHVDTCRWNGTPLNERPCFTLLC